jgi:predicted MFS family arabinose efflux permease
MLLLPAGNRLYFYFAIAVFYGFLNSGCSTNSIFYAGITGKHPKKNMALHEMISSLGTAAGSAGGGFFYQHFRFTGTCIALFLVLSLGMVFLVLLNRKDVRMSEVLSRVDGA